jgi:ABC-2 type transport system permease protein
MTTATSTTRSSSSFVALYRLFLRMQVTRGRLLALGTLAALGILTAVAIVLSDPFDADQRGATFVNNFGLSLLVPVACLVFAAAALGDLREDGSLVYLWLRPVSRTTITLSAWLSTLTATLPIILVTLGVIAAVISGEPDVVIGALVSGLTATIVYSAIFLAVGLRVQRALVWGLAYVLIWEGFVARAGASAAKVSLASYTRSILTNTSDTSLELATISPLWSYVVPLIVTFVALAYVVRRFQHQDVA